ncbi:MAG: alkaline phosphatase [Candidatus Hydrogenedentota bacterium]
MMRTCFCQLFLAALVTSGSAYAQPFLAQGIMSGEVTANSALLQTRLTGSDGPVDGDVPGAPGWVRFDLSEAPDFSRATATPWVEAVAENDFIARVPARDLKPGAEYHYRAVYGATKEAPRLSHAGRFRTLNPSVPSPVRFVVVTGMNYNKFHNEENAYTGPDKPLGYPALWTMRNLMPDFFVGTGDNVYYDHPREGAAETLPQLRKKWHEQFVQQRYRDLFAFVPTYWEKDDHDHRFNDCDTTGDRLPQSDLGIKTFVEQMPVLYPDDPNGKTYRTHRLSKLAQIWFVEGRDYRSPNASPDGPEKTLWGAEQLAWLKETLLTSDAPYKFLVSPTPLIGPDDAYKKDNHTNPEGFRTEGEAFFAWLGENRFQEKGFYILCGDRHWQYHSIRPDGFEEFSSGALVTANARIGRSPGDPESTDPDAKIKQPYTQTVASGGFLLVNVEEKEGKPTARFTFHDEFGAVLYTVEK